MDDGLYRLSDEVLGARDAGSRLAGDLEFAEAELVRVRARYLARFFCRLAVVTLAISIRVAWRVASRRGWFRWPRAR